MSGDADVKAFADAIGATEPSPESPNYQKWKMIFRRSNYFRWNGMFVVVKISRSKKPFWGVGKEILDLLNLLEDYRLVLLASPKEGWAFSKAEVEANISSLRWKLREADGNYKINPPLPDRNGFFSPQNFIKKFAPDENETAT